MVDGFRSFLEGSGLSYRVLVGHRPVEDAENEFVLSSGYEQPYTLAPVIEGSKNALGTILTGVALIGLAALAGPAAFGALSGAWAAGWGATAGYFAAHVGVGLVLGGLSQLVSPTPKSGSPAERPENKPSNIFNGPVNTTAQGHPVPVCYGRLIVGSAVISAGISVGDIA